MKIKEVIKNLKIKKFKKKFKKKKRKSQILFLKKVSDAWILI